MYVKHTHVYAKQIAKGTLLERIREEVTEVERAGIREEAESEWGEGWGWGVIEKGVGRGKHIHTTHTPSS